MEETLGSKTNFQKVQEFNRAFDMVTKEPANYLSGENDVFGRTECNSFLHGRIQLFTEQPKLIRLRLDLIKEELGELHAAIVANDYIEIRDALSDILYVVYGMADVLGINMDVLVSELIKSQVPTTPSSSMQIFERIIIYTNKDKTNGRPIGMTHWNWVQLYMNLFPSKFYYNLLDISILPYKSNGGACGDDGTDGAGGAGGGAIERDKLVAEMMKIFTYIEKLCYINEDISFNLFETIGNNLAKLIILDYTYSYFMDTDADADFAIVHSSNMSKLCDTEDDAQATVADYEAKFQKGVSPYDSPYYYALPELGKWIVKNKSTGKALKNIKYQKVVFS